MGAANVTNELLSASQGVILIIIRLGIMYEMIVVNNLWIAEETMFHNEIQVVFCTVGFSLLCTIFDGVMPSLNFDFRIHRPYKSVDISHSILFLKF